MRVLIELFTQQENCGQKNAADLKLIPIRNVLSMVSIHKKRQDITVNKHSSFKLNFISFILIQ